MRRLSAFCVLFVLLTTGAYWIAASPDGTRGIRYIALHVALTLLMLACWRLEKAAAREASRWLLGAGIAARLVLIPVAPFTTHDLDRYMWDGAATLAGLDPYQVTPNAPEAQPVSAIWPVAQEHAAYQTLYPPGALMVFAACAASGPTLAPWLFKTIVAIASIFLMLATARLLRRREALHHLALVALSPLLVLEGGIGSHVDILAALGLACGLMLWSESRWGWAGAALAAGALIKLGPLVAVAPLAWSATDRRQSARMVAGAAVILLVFYGSALFFGLLPFGSIGLFFTKWRFGSPLGALIGGLPDLARLSIAVVLGLIGLAVAVIWAKRAPLRATLLAVSLPLLVSPVVFPWYLAPLVPVLAVFPSAFAIGWVSSAPLTYEVIDAFDANGSWQPAVWPLVFIAAVWIAGLVFDKSRRSHVVAKADKLRINH